MNVEAGQIWSDEEDTYLIIKTAEGIFNALKISREPSMLAPLSLLYTGVGVDEEVIREELTFVEEELLRITTEVLKEVE